MLKYKLKKGVSLKVGMTFRYNSNEELKALANALDVYDKIPSSQSTLRHDGFLIIKGYNNEETNYFQIEKVMFSKYLTKSTEYLVKKKDFFKKIKDIDTEVIDKELKKIELDNANDVNVDGDKFEKSLDGCSFREGLYSNDNTKDLSVLERLASLRNDLVQNKQYEIAAEVRDIESSLITPYRNSSVVSKGIVSGTFKGDTINYSDAIDHSSACLKTINKNTVNRIQENLPKIKGNEGVKNFFDMLYNLKIIVVDGKFKNQTDSFENATSLDGKDILIYTRKDGSKMIIE